MADGSKRYRGQIQTFDGGPTGEPVVTAQYAYNAAGLIQFLGEAKYGTLDNANDWYLTQFLYDGNGDLSKVTTAINQVTSKATAVTVDKLSNPGFVRIQAIGGDLTLVNIGDLVYLKTSANNIQGNQIVQKLSATEVLIVESVASNETATPIAFTDLTFFLEQTTVKNFDKRRWDKRDSYIYQ